MGQQAYFSRFSNLSSKPGHVGFLTLLTLFCRKKLEGWAKAPKTREQHFYLWHECQSNSQFTLKF
jgi:hypothetical protein